MIKAFNIIFIVVAILQLNNNDVFNEQYINQDFGFALLNPDNDCVLAMNSDIENVVNVKQKISLNNTICFVILLIPNPIKRLFQFSFKIDTFLLYFSGSSPP